VGKRIVYRWCETPRRKLRKEELKMKGVSLAPVVFLGDYLFIENF